MALDEPASEADIRALYRIVLRREAESDAVVRNYTDNGLSVAIALTGFLACPEYVERGVYGAAAAIWNTDRSGVIETRASEAQLAEMRGHVARVWSAYGESETYWSVLTADQYRDSAIGPAAVAQFYASGYETWAQIAPMLARNGISFDGIRSVLDFGCGVGRLAAPFSEHFGRYIGVDISPGHLRLAREHAAANGLADAAFLDIGAFLTADDLRYDLYYSLIVLQHNPPPIIREMLRAGLARVNQGGLALFQVPATLTGYSFSVEQYLAGGWRDTMEMHALPQPAVFEELDAAGFRLLEVVPDPYIGPAGLSYLYLARRH